MKTKAFTILFTSVGRRVELVRAFRAAAEELHVPLVLLGADLTLDAPALYFCDVKLQVPPIKDPAYVPALLEICRTRKVDVLIPTIDTDLLLLAMHSPDFAALGTRVLIADPQKIALCRDKTLTSDYFLSLGLLAPKAVGDVASYTGGYPAFIKPKDGSSSINAFRADSKEELLSYAARMDNYVIQPYIRGREYTIDCYCNTTGAPVFITPRERLAVRAGEVLKTKICQDETMIAQMQVLLKDFAPRGAITVQLIQDEETKENYYIEINPRFGGGAPLSMKAGADAAKALFKELQGAPMPYQPYAAVDGAVYSRFDESICVTCGQKRQPLQAVVFDLDDTLYLEKDYVRSGFRAVAELLPQVCDAEEKLWQLFLEGQAAIDCLLAAEGLYTKERAAACLAIYRSHTPEIALEQGVLEGLLRLRSLGLKLAILTDGRPQGQRAKIEALGLEALVDEILITDALGGAAFRKPCDIGFRILQKKLDVPFGTMCYVADNGKKDFQAPKALGMQSLWLDNARGLYREVVPENVPRVTDFDGVLAWLLNGF